MRMICPRCREKNRVKRGALVARCSYCNYELPLDESSTAMEWSKDVECLRELNVGSWSSVGGDDDFWGPNGSDDNFWGHNV